MYFTMEMHLLGPVLKQENEIIVYEEGCSKPEITITDEHDFAGKKGNAYPVTVL